MTGSPLNKPSVFTVIALGDPRYGYCKSLTITLQNKRRARQGKTNVVRFVRPVNRPMTRPGGLPNR